MEKEETINRFVEYYIAGANNEVYMARTRQRDTRYGKVYQEMKEIFCVNFRLLYSLDDALCVLHVISKPLILRRHSL